MMDDDDLLALDYEQTTAMVRMLTDVRFKLLALVPTVSAVGVAVAEARAPHEAVAIAALGLLATVGVLVYELRNTDLYDAALHRAKWLERLLGMRLSSPYVEGDVLGGVFAERPARRDRHHPDPRYVFGLTVWHDMAWHSSMRRRSRGGPSSSRPPPCRSCTLTSVCLKRSGSAPRR